VLGFLVSIPSLAVALALVWSNAPLAAAFVFFFATGVGAGLSTNAALTLLRAVTESSSMGRVTSAHMFTRNQGFTFGAAIGGAVLLFVVTLELGDLELVRQLIAEGTPAAGAAEAVRDGFAASIGVGLGLTVFGLFASIRLRRALSAVRLAKRGV
jgi:hypothetical protein